MKRRIKPYQYILMMLCFVHGSKLLLSFMDNTAKQDSWLMVISGFIVSIPFVLSYAFLARRFPDKNLMEIHEAVYGKALGKAISALYILFILYLISLNLRVLSDFYVGNILPDTPPTAILVVFMTCCAAFAVRFGIDAIAKVSIAVGAIIILTETISVFMLIGDMDFSNFLPILDKPVQVYMHTTLVMASIPYCELFLFMMVMPELAGKQRIGRLTVLGLALPALLLLSITVRNTAVLGASGAVYAITSFQSVRMINIGEFLTRVELLVALGVTVSLFIKISVIFFSASRGIASVLHLKTYNRLLWPLGAITVVYALVVHDSEVSHMFIASRYHVILTLPFEFILPPLTLLIAKLRRLPGDHKKLGRTLRRVLKAAENTGQAKNG